jgi:hypothetical protein
MLLAFVTVVNVWAFMESEGAELVIEDVGFARGEPSPEADGLDVIVLARNFGKHVATVRIFNISPAIFIHQKQLPDKPEFRGGSITPVVPPIDPGRQISVYGKQGPQDFGRANFGIAREDIIRGALDGSITVRIYGFVQYYTGYSVFNHAEVGYCFSYIPENRRRNTRFEVCYNPNEAYDFASGEINML